ncbi:hypothetical protein H7E67_04610 [Clostridium gasigenes]|uniref:hypothetical protein n=1 Tax=Clostridium gasigenes TaxID=94869 RepID=UPI001623F37A|nr:hypothetical protein [Clostridium gasigenes]MBB6622698.1 hypothetical protein [Clostridium gasigenes]MBU3132886.1 hypothetical protein [Clostridium gasigenes]MBU3136654.1 hypothetical protein [Clostridium gasigenes]
MNKKLGIVKDVRHQSYITYNLKNISLSLGYDSLEKISNYDTIDNFLKNLEVIKLEII